MQFFRGDTFRFDFGCSQENGETYVFQAGDILKVGVKGKANDARYLLFKKIDINENTEIVTIVFEPEETKKCNTGKQMLEVELTDKDGNITTLYQDYLTIEEDLINE